MRVLIFHGYLLRGTGSNVYNAELAQALAAHGHDVHLFSQDRQAAELDWVDRVGTWQAGRLTVQPTAAGRGRPPRRGGVTAYRPEIADLLPVYVYDRYDGFEVKTFPQLSGAELERYLSLNVAAVEDVTRLVGGFDAALANHLVMGPVILARAGLQFAAKIHGSDLSYTVRPHPERFVPYAREGMAAASAALVGSRHTAEDLWQTVSMPGLREKTRLGPPGLDPELFAPRSRSAAERELKELAAALAEQARSEPASLEARQFGRDPAAAATALEWFAEAQGERVIFVGKLLVNKGIDLLLAAWPLVVARHPDVRLLIAGFGAFAEPAEDFWRILAGGDLAAARRWAADAKEDGQPRRLRILGEFLADPPAGYAAAAQGAAGSVRISGRLEHREVGIAVPAAAALVMPSTFPEAFGMVTAEAAAGGVLPISARHSGMAEVSQRLAEAVEPEVAALLGFDLEDDPVTAIADRIGDWLALPADRRRRAAGEIRRRAVDLWSWQGVADGVIEASAGRLEGLPKVP